MVVEGHVIRKRINVGSKSEHDAAVLMAGSEQFKLRKSGGHPFADPEVQALVGRRIKAEGFVSAGQFIMERYVVLPDETS
jgi:hypothetical protein